MPIIGFEDVPGEMFKALEEAGHGRRLVIADRSLDIDPDGNVVVDYRGRSSAQALHSVLRLVRREGPVTTMAPDLNDRSELGRQATNAFMRVAKELDIMGEVQSVPRLSRDATDSVGFYDLISSEERKLIVRTPDSLPYACATFVVGHSQFGAETAT